MSRPLPTPPARCAPDAERRIERRVRGLVWLAFVLADVEHASDVAMGDAAGQPDLVAEAFESGGVADQLFAQHLQRHLFVELNVAGAIDAAARADSQELDDLVALAIDQRG